MADRPPTTSPDSSEDDRIRRAVAGDADALSALLSLHGPAVERGLQINPIWQNVLEPADVMQVTYLEAFMQIGRFEPDRGTPFVVWLRRIAENNLRDAIRGLERQKQPQPGRRVQPAATDDSMVGFYDVLMAESTTPSRLVRRDEICASLSNAINSLPDRYAEVIRLYDLENVPISDIAQRLGRSPGAVHMLRARAHERLRHQLEPLSGF